MRTTSVRERSSEGEAPPRVSHRNDKLWRVTWVVAGLAVLGWLPFVGRLAGPDEGGFLMVASQWNPGTSLYGNYWVDRPPLLVLIHELAVALGGTVALRVIGIVAVVSSVLLASTLVRTVTGRGRSRTDVAPVTVSLLAPVVVAGTFLTTPLFGATEVDGELLAVPFVLAGVLACVRAWIAPTPAATTGWALAAGAAGACAAMTKQNSVDVLVFAAVLLILGLRAGDRCLRVAVGLGLGAVATGLVILGIAALHGTGPGGLWDAVVTFRFEAAEVIRHSATSSNSDRMHVMLHAAVATLAPVVVAVLAWQSRRSLGAEARGNSLDLRWPAVAMLLWEAFSVAGGGSFWLHYLINLVPGMVVLAVAAAQRPLSNQRFLACALVAAVLSAGFATLGAVHAKPYPSEGLAVAYLREHARPGDTATVAFGQPNILWEAHLSSPYPELWSLPVRVRDPQLTGLSHLMASRRAPTWLVVDGSSLTSWGIDATRADRVMAARYHRTVDLGRYEIWHLDHPPSMIRCMRWRANQSLSSRPRLTSVWRTGRRR